MSNQPNRSRFQDGTQGIPYFDKGGTALSQSEREDRARKRGICVTCGVKTHNLTLLRRTPITDERVYQGWCILDYPEHVPTEVSERYRRQFRPATAPITADIPANRFKTAALAATAVSRPKPTSAKGSAPPSSAPASAPAITAAVSHASARSENKTRDNSPEPPAEQEQKNQQTQISSNGADDYRSTGHLEPFALVGSLADNRENPDAIRRALHDLRNHVDDPAGAMYGLHELIEDFKNDPGIMALAVGSVWAIASPSDDKKEEVTECGVTEQILDVIRIGTSQGSIVAVEWAIGSLVCLAQTPDNRDFIVIKGGIEAIVGALCKFGTSPGIFEWSTRALFMLMHCHDSNDAAVLNAIDRNIATFDEAGGVSTIMDVMKIHTAEPVAQWWCVKLLWALQDIRDTSVSERFQKKFINVGCMSTCTKILLNRATSKDNFRQTSELLYRLLVVHSSSSPPTASTFLESSVDCIPTCARMITENGNEPGLLASCFRLLSALATSNVQSQQAIAEHRLVRLAANTLTHHIKEAALVEAIIQFLWVASGDSSSFDYSVMRSLKSSVDRSISLYKNKSDFICSTCGLVSNLCLSDHVKSLSDLAVDSITKLSASKVDPDISQHLCRTLASIYCKFPEAIELTQLEGLVNSFMDGLNSQDSSLQILCSNALTSIMLLSKENSDLICSQGCISTASEALASASSEELAESMLEFISVLVTSTSSSVMQLPSGTMENILEATISFPSTRQAACVAIMNSMIVSVPGFSVPKLEDLITMLVEIIESDAGPIVEACGAIWATTARRPAVSHPQLSRLIQALIYLMNQYKDEDSFVSDIQTAASGALSGVMQCARENSIHVGENDIAVIKAVANMTFEVDFENTPLIVHLLDVLLAISSSTKHAPGEDSVASLAIDFMSENESHEIIQQKGCGILALVSSMEDLQVNFDMVDNDGIDKIIVALGGFSDNAELQLNGCRALSHLSIDQELRVSICTQGGLIFLVNAMIRFKDDVELLEAACSALLNISSDADEQVLGGFNLVDPVVNTMTHHPELARIQELGLGVLQNISMRSRNAKKTIADSGGVDAVAFAAKEFMGSPVVLERAFTTMWSLAVLDENQIRIAECGGINLVVNGMLANISYEKVQKQACGCLCSLSSDSTNKSLIRDAGGVDSIVYAMWAHYNSEKLQVEACRALSSLAVNVQTNEVTIATEAEIGAIMSAMRRFPASERVQEHACVAIRNFLLSIDNVNLIRHDADGLRELMDHASTRFPNQCAGRAQQVCMSLS